jgi:hypothetical protein
MLFIRPGSRHAGREGMRLVAPMFVSAWDSGMPGCMGYPLYVPAIARQKARLLIVLEADG